jgi:hypothetical protein
MAILMRYIQVRNYVYPKVPPVYIYIYKRSTIAEKRKTADTKIRAELNPSTKGPKRLKNAANFLMETALRRGTDQPKKSKIENLISCKNSQQKIQPHWN